MPIPKRFKAGITEISAVNLNKAGHTNFNVHAQDTPDMTVFIEDGVAIILGTVVKYAGGNSPTLTAPVGGDKRIDLITINSAGTIAITQGTPAGSPSAPAYPTDKLVLAEVYLRTGATTILDEDDSAECYIYRCSFPASFGGTPLVINTLTEKTSPVSADLLLIEDSQATNAQKKLQVGNLPKQVDYGEDSQVSDAYVITCTPAPTAYALGQMYLFRANTANTGACTLNVNGLGALAIYKTYDNDPANNDIMPQQMVMVAYSEHYVLSDYYDQSHYDELLSYLDSSGDMYCGQSFTALNTRTLGKASFWLKKTGSPSGSMYVYLYAHAGSYGSSSVPTGAPLATSDPVNANTLTTSYAKIDFKFSGAQQYAMTASANYCIVVSFTGGNGSNRVMVGGDAYFSPSHSGNYFTSANGSSWTPSSGIDCIFWVYDNLPCFEMISQLAN